MIIDPYLDVLKGAARSLDTQLSKLARDAQSVEDPDMSGQYEGAEYLTGLGFVACQQYMNCAFAGKGIKKRLALDLGPKHRCGEPFAALVNAAAYHWKHCTEWDGPKVDRARAEQTSKLLRSLGINLEQSYVLANALHEILRPHPARFRYLIPFLERWRDDAQSNHESQT